MRREWYLLAALICMTCTSPAVAWEPDSDNELELLVAKTLASATEKDPGLDNWMIGSVAYAVFPRVAKAGMGIGGAHGKGIVIQGGNTIGQATLTQFTIGFQFGGQVYAELIFFRDQTALDDFKQSNYEVGAQISAVAVKAGASAEADFNSGVVIFTIAEGGLMYEASVGGQKFNYTANP
jgi:lipid-binding SYLF domain-containing protein